MANTDSPTGGIIASAVLAILAGVFWLLAIATLADLASSDAAGNALAQAYASTGKRAEAVQLLRSLQLREASGEVLPAFPLIWAHAALGDYDEAFARLEKAYREHRDRMVWVKVDPQLAPLRADARFHDLVRRMNMTSMKIVTSSR